MTSEIDILSRRFRDRAIVVRTADITPLGQKLQTALNTQATQIQQVFKEQKQSGKALSTIFHQVTGKDLPVEYERAYKRQQIFELKVIHAISVLDLDTDPVAPEEVASLIDRLLSLELCNRYKLLPVRQVDDVVTVAMLHPDNLEANDDLKQRMRTNQLQLQRVVMLPSDFNSLMAGYMDAQADVLAAQSATAKQDEQDGAVADTIADLDLGGLDDSGDDETSSSLEQQIRSADDAPIVKLANHILIKALQEGTSDIHIEPQEESLRVRFRKDGVLRQPTEFAALPKRIIPAITARFKIISDLNIAERRQPQDGRIRRIFQGRKVDFRVSTLPSRYGEKIVLRILDNSSTQLGLDKLISDEETLSNFKEIVRRPFGLILVTGPTGSGKTTTLYSALAEVNDPGVNISTAEDPIEYTLPGLCQVQVIREKGMDFAKILRAFLRQDPDVILVGETRDLETAKTAIEASLTGHLVLTTLHTNDAPGAITRLVEMGIEPHMISSSLLGVLAQRLMRRVCTECRIPYNPSREELAQYGLIASGDSEFTFYKANALTPKELDEHKKLNKPICKKCGGVGYKGRVGVYEFMRMNDSIAELINKEAPTDVIKDAAVEAGMKTLLAYSLMLVQQGHTTLAEVDRVTLTDKGIEGEMKARARSLNTCRTCGAELHLDWMDCPYCLTPKFQ